MPISSLTASQAGDFLLFHPQTISKMTIFCVLKSSDFRSRNSKIYSWEDPLSGKVYTLKSVVKDPEKFPVGSSVAFLIDPAHPRWHCIENMQDTGYRRFEA